MSKKETDFAKILTELKDKGIGDYDMEKLTGINRSNLTKLRTGKRGQPKYDDGVAIMEVYNENA